MFLQSAKHTKYLHWLPFALLFFLADSIHSQAQDWRASAGYSLKSFPMSYVQNPSYPGTVSSLRKGVVQLELEKYFYYGVYGAGQLEFILQNDADELFGGSANFQQANLGVSVGYQWPKWGVYAGIEAGHLWNLRLRGTDTETGNDDKVWIRPQNTSSAWTSAIKGGIKYYLLSFLRLQAEWSKVAGLPMEVVPADNPTVTPDLNALDFQSYTFHIGASISIPWNSKNYNRGTVPPGKLPELRDIKEVNFVSPMPSGAVVTSPFGSRWGRNHEGVDLDARRGDPVRAAADGVVVIAGKGTGYGKTIRIRHGAGFTTVYAHLSRVDVRYGQSVKQGEIIGRAGSTGTASGPHLHFEILENGQHRDPQAYIRF